MAEEGASTATPPTSRSGMKLHLIEVNNFVNFKTPQTLVFSTGKDIDSLSDIFTFVGENNAGKSSMLQLIEVASNPIYILKGNTLNVSDPSKDAIVICKYLTNNSLDTNLGSHPSQQGESSGHGAQADTPNVYSVYLGVYIPKDSESLTGYRFRLEVVGETGQLHLRKLDLKRKPCEITYSTSIPWASDNEMNITIADICKKHEADLKATSKGVPIRWANLVQVGTDIEDDDMMTRLKMEEPLGSPVLKFMNSLCSAHYEIDNTKTGFRDKLTGLTWDAKFLPDGHKTILKCFLKFEKMVNGPQTGSILLLDDITKSLHPTLIKRFTWAIRDRIKSDKLAQVIATNLSCEFLDATYLENVFRFVRYPDGTSHVRQMLHLEEDGTTTLSTEKAKWKKRIITEGFAKALFSKMVLVVEGRSDKLFLEALLDLMIMDDSDLKDEWSPDNERNKDKMHSMLIDTCIISVEGKAHIPEVVKYLTVLDVPFIVVCDADACFLLEKDTHVSPASRDAVVKSMSGQEHGGGSHFRSRPSKDSNKNKAAAGDLPMAHILCNQVDLYLNPPKIGQVIPDRHLQEELKSIAEAIKEKGSNIRSEIEQIENDRKELDTAADNGTDTEVENKRLGKKLGSLKHRLTNLTLWSILERIPDSTNCEVGEFYQKCGRVFAWKVDLEYIVECQMQELSDKYKLNKKDAFRLTTVEERTAIIKKVIKDSIVEEIASIIKNVIETDRTNNLGSIANRIIANIMTVIESRQLTDDDTTTKGIHEIVVTVIKTQARTDVGTDAKEITAQIMKEFIKPERRIDIDRFFKFVKDVVFPYYVKVGQ